PPPPGPHRRDRSRGQRRLVQGRPRRAPALQVHGRLLHPQPGRQARQGVSWPRARKSTQRRRGAKTQKSSERCVFAPSPRLFASLRLCVSALIPGRGEPTARRGAPTRSREADGPGRQKAKSPQDHDLAGSPSKSRRRPTLPPGCPGSTIGSKELDFRVRDGIGYDLLDITTGNLWVRVCVASRRSLAASRCSSPELRARGSSVALEVWSSRTTD